MGSHWKSGAVVGGVLSLAVARAAMGADGTEGSADVSGEIQALKSRIADLERKQGENWLTQERTEQIKGIVRDVIADARTRGQYADGPTVGYKDGFFIQTPDNLFKLSVGGYVQARYEYGYQNAYNRRSLSSRTPGSTSSSGGGSSSAGGITPDDPGNASGFSLRKARVNFSGNIFSTDATFRLEGDFEGGSGGAFTVTDAFIAYRFNDLLRVRVGAFKAPFAKAELTADPFVPLADRPEVLSPFDPVRALGLSVYGDILPGTLNYEVNVNDGARTNVLRQPDTVSGTANLDNRLAFYGRVQWAGAGKIADFADESDLTNIDHFVWLLGVAAGYESQNATNNAFPAPQTTANIQGLSNGDGPGFANYTLNGDVFRGTIDWSAKWNGLSIVTAAYFQQVNANSGNTSNSSATSVTTGPYGRSDASFFEHGYYAQVGYFVIPKRLELIGRAGALLTEGYPNVGEYYTAAANYYFYGHNLKLQSDVTYSPESSYSDPNALQLQNTQDLTFRVQLQLKF